MDSIQAYQVAKIKTGEGEMDLQPHRHNFYEFFLFLDGAGTHLVDFEAFEITSNSLHLVQPGQLHQVQHALHSQGYVLKVASLLIHASPLLTQMIQQNLYHPNFRACWQIAPEEAQFIAQSYKQLAQVPAHSYFATAALSATLNWYFTLLIRSQNLPPLQLSNKEVLHFYQFRQLLEQHYHTQVSVHFYTEQMGLSLKQLNRLTKKHTGNSVKQLLNIRLALEAQRQVAYGHRSIKEIAYELSFLEPAHFTHFFKKHHQCTPTAFRQRFQ